MIDMPRIRAPREIIGATLAHAAQQAPQILVLDADLGRSTRLTIFEERFPNRYIQFGVAEQNAVGFASGLVYAGFKPVFVSFTMFAIGLPWTQLRQAAYAELPIVIIGTHPGLDIGPDGGTHQMIEDLALSRAIPELVIMTPCDTPETSAAIFAALSLDRTTYVRVGRHPVPDLHTDVSSFPIGKAEILRESGEQLLLIADGSMAWTALQAADILAQESLDSTIINIRSIKPIDEETLIKRSKGARLVVTLENHNVIGGLGAAVLEILGTAGKKVLRLGIPDAFGQSGTTEELRALYDLTAEGVAESIRKHL